VHMSAKVGPLLLEQHLLANPLVVRVRSAQRGKRVKSPRPQALTQAFIYKALKFIEMKLDLTENLFDTTHGA
jgi:hypothetical protein